MKDKAFLHQKYVVERLSVNQIVALPFSSRSTVKTHLAKTGIALRPEDKRLGVIGYGEKRLKGLIVKNQAEIKLMKKIKDLRATGIPVQKIADLLQNMNIPTKKGGKWSRRTVYAVLEKMVKKGLS